MAVVCLFLFGGAGVVSAQNQIVNGTLTVHQDVFLNSASGNTSINGNLTLGSSNSNSISYNGVAATSIDLGENSILNLGSLTVGEPSGVGAPYVPVTGAITLYNSAGTGTATIQAANTGSASFTYTIPNGGANGTFVMTSGAQTLTGAKTFTNLPLANTAPLVVNNTHVSGAGLNALGATITSTGASTGGTNTALTLTASGATTNTALAVTSGNVNVAGLTASKPVFTDANKNLTSTGTVPVGSGGTGMVSLTAYEVVAANSSGNALTQVSGTGGAGQVLTSNGAGALPTWQQAGGTVTSNTASQTVPATEDLNASNAAGYVRLTNSTGGQLNVTGIQSAPFMNGSVVTLVNVSTAAGDVIQLTNLDPAATSTNDQFDLPGNQPILLGQKGAATFIYDGTLNYWELVSTND